MRLSQEEPILERKQKKKRYFIIYADINIYAIFSLNLFFYVYR